MLVNTHKLLFGLMALIGVNTMQAQETWSLKQSIDSALVYNKSLRINRNNMAISEQREKEARANLNPKITANADYRYFMDLPYQLMPMSAFNPTAPVGKFKEAQFGVPHNINANVLFMMPVYNPQIKGAIANASIGKELAQLQYQQTEDQVLYDITTLYYNIQILLHQLTFTDSNLINTGKLLKNMQLLNEQLLAKGTDVSKVRLQAEQLKTNRDIVYNKYVQLMNALKLAMGISLAREITVEKHIVYLPAPEYTVDSSTDMQIIRARNKLLVSELNTLNKSRFLPSLNLLASYGINGFGYDKKPDNFLKFYPAGYAGVQLTYPLFNGMITKRKITQKKLELSNIDLQAQLTSDKNTADIENISRQRSVTQQTIANAEKQIELARTIYEQTIIQQKQGTANLTDVLLADNSFREAQQNYLAAIIEFLKADLDLKKLSGNISSGK